LTCIIIVPKHQWSHAKWGVGCSRSLHAKTNSPTLVIDWFTITYYYWSSRQENRKLL